MQVLIETLIHISRSQLDDWKIEGDDTEANMERDARMMLYWVSGHHYILDIYWKYFLIF